MKAVLKVQIVQVIDGVAKQTRPSDQEGNKERQVPLPESFGRVLALQTISK